MKLDLVTANWDSAIVSVLLGNGQGGFGLATDFVVSRRPRSVAIGDLNGDQKPDLVTANSLSSNVSVVLGNGLGNFTAPLNFAVGFNPYFVAFGDKTWFSQTLTWLISCAPRLIASKNERTLDQPISGSH